MQCLDVLKKNVPNVVDQNITDYTSNNASQAALNAFRQCSAPLQKEKINSSYWAIVGVGILLSVATVIYYLFPKVTILRERLIKLENQTSCQEITTYLSNLCQEVSFSNPPVFLLKPTSGSLSAKVFGRLGRYYLVIPGGLITLFNSNLPKFRAVVLHERLARRR